MTKIKTIVNLIKPCKCVYDIGSDHAYLSILLLQEKKVKLVVNIDKNKKPLLNGINNLKKENLLTKTLNIQSDGFNQIIDTNLSIPDYVVMSGIGGLNMIKILELMPKEFITSKFILVPNSNEYLLRKWVNDNNYSIFNEKIIYEKKKFYHLIEFQKNKIFENLSELELHFGPINLSKNKLELKEFLCAKKGTLEKNKSLNKSIVQKKYYSYINQALERLDENN